MKKKTLFITFLTIIAVMFLSISSFAENNMASDAVQGVRNVVGGAENVVEDAAKDIAGGVREGISDVENTGEDMTRTDNTQQMQGGAMTSDDNNGGYTATRTATTGTGNTFLGMNATTWTWIIMAIVGIAIVALVWYYGKQNELTSHNHDDNY